MTAEVRHWFGPSGESSGGGGHPVMFTFAPAVEYERFPEGGGYPKGFLERAYRLVRAADPDRVLHLCSGSVQRGIRLDVRAEKRPTVIADARHAPFRDATFDAILIDPPYSEDYASNLYGTGEVYPTPGALMAEACRLLRPGGRVGLLHFQVPMIRKPLRMVGVWGITTGAGYAIRAFTVCEKPHQLALAVPGTEEGEGHG